MGNKTHLYSFFLFFLFITGFVQSELFAATLSPVRIFNRCYADLTNTPVPLNDSRIAQIKNGALDPIQACVNLLEATQINPSDSEGKLTNPTNTEQLNVLRNFYKITSKFVGRNWASDNLGGFFEGFSATEDFYDFTSEGLSFTEAIFNPNRQFKEIFTINRLPVAKRVLDSSIPYPFKANSQNQLAPRTRHAGCCPDAKNDLYVMGHGTENFPGKLIQSGELSGISYSSPVQTVAGREVRSYDIPRFDMNQNAMPGIVGQRTYIMANTNFVDGRSDLLYMPRRLSRAISQDFLCRDLPILRESDITSLVSTNVNAIPFRKASSCTQCHAFMDQLASVFRGLTSIQSMADNNATARNTYHANLSPAKLAAESTTWPAVLDADFWQRPAKGKLYFRSLTKTDGPLSIDLANPSALGTALASTDDVHICFAKKMFKQLTGVDVKLIDIYDPANSATLQSMTTADYDYRSFVINLGTDLKVHQNSKKLIEDILHSQYYIQSDFLTGGP